MNILKSLSIIFLGLIFGLGTLQAGELQLDASYGKVPAVTFGQMRHCRIYSDELKGYLTVDIWLPPAYESDAHKHFPVIYMHDGQNLFDPALSFAGAAWEIDATLEKLIGRDIVNAPIVVGIHNRATFRPSDYIPERPVMEYISEDDRDASGMWELTGNKFYADEYLAFLVNTLKPEIDRLFRTLPDCGSTSIMGSSMGGLASLYAMCEYPQVFGCAACLSTHWIGNFDYDNTIFPNAMLAYIADHLPDPASHRLYLDRGTIDLDSSYENWERQARDLVRSKGYTEDSGNFLCMTDEGASHNEIYWALRVDVPLHFILHSDDNPYIPEVPELQAFHVIFQDASKPWSKVNAFAWAPGVLQLGAWPGKAMTEIEYEGGKAWEIKFSHKVAPANIIFNNGSSQTKDLDFKPDMVYDFSGPLKNITSGISEIVDSSGLKIFVRGGMLQIESEKDMEIPLYSLEGLQRRLRLFRGLNVIGNLPAGIYFLYDKKILIP
ncbi:MAG: starch-binding protein [Muribaculaceae bacterium]|nr:starch-binding protein [Muribaculaceae bacterium]